MLNTIFSKLTTKAEDNCFVNNKKKKIDLKERKFCGSKRNLEFTGHHGNWERKFATNNFFWTTMNWLQSKTDKFDLYVFFCFFFVFL